MEIARTRKNKQRKHEVRAKTLLSKVDYNDNNTTQAPYEVYYVQKRTKNEKKATPTKCDIHACLWREESSQNTHLDSTQTEAAQYTLFSQADAAQHVQLSTQKDVAQHTHLSQANAEQHAQWNSIADKTKANEGQTRDSKAQIGQDIKGRVRKRRKRSNQSQERRHTYTYFYTPVQ